MKWLERSKSQILQACIFDIFVEDIAISDNLKNLQICFKEKKSPKPPFYSYKRWPVKLVSESHPQYLRGKAH